VIICKVLQVYSLYIQEVKSGAVRRVRLYNIRVTLDFPPLTDISEHAVIQAAVFIEDAAQVIWLKKCF